MLRSTILILGLVVTFGLVGCGKKDGGGGEGKKGKKGKGCPPAKVTVDGKVVELKAPGFGVKMKGYDGYLIYLHTYDGPTCKNALTGIGMPAPAGGQTFRVSAVNGQVNTVGIGAYTQVGIKAKIKHKPTKEGDPVSICIRKPVEFSPTVGAEKGKKVVARGLFEAKYCGELK